jgi:hypothetical protein
VSRQDPGAATGQSHYPTFPACECGCDYSTHASPTRVAGQLVAGGCSNSRCNCRRYRSAVELPPSAKPYQCEQCGHAMTQQEFDRLTREAADNVIRGGGVP